MLLLTMLPFSQTLIHWRNRRGLTQGRLAEKAGLPRPNLSDIERGRRDVTLATLRRLAAALDIRPGVLADGLTEETPAPKPFSRASLERIARLVWNPSQPGSAEEKWLAGDLRLVMAPQIAVAAEDHRRPRGTKKAALAAWTRLKGTLPAPVLSSLLTRAREAGPSRGGASS